MDGQCHGPAVLPPGKTRYPLYMRLGGPQGRSGRVRKTSPKPGLNPGTVQPLASRYTDCAIPSHDRILYVMHKLRLRVCEKRMLKRVFGPKWFEVTVAWWRLHNKELNDVKSSQNIVRVIKSRLMRLAGHVAWKGERRGTYKIFVAKPERKRPLGRPKRR
jgi:hypothetical protein